MTPLQLRTAQPTDIDALVDIVHRAYRGGEGEAGWTTESELLGGQRTDAEAIAHEIADRDGRLIVAVDASDAIVGCIKVDRRGNTTHFGLFAVDPRRQSSGAGTVLLGAVEQQAHEWGCSTVAMEVINLRDDLKAWYERKGFRPTGETVPFPYGDERFGLPRRNDLVLDVFAKTLSADTEG